MRLQPRVVPLIPVKGILLPCVPPKVAFYAWEETQGRSLMLDKLQKRGWHLPNRCFLCGCEEEMVHHILLCCSMVRYLWGIICSLVGISWVVPGLLRTLFNWRGPLWGKRKERPGILFHCACFQCGRREIVQPLKMGLYVQKLKHSFVYNVWNWNRMLLGGEAHLLIGFLGWMASY